MWRAVLSLLWAAGCAAAGPVALRGVVREPDRTPVAGAAVVAETALRSRAAAAVTGASGGFTLSLAPGDYVLIVRRAGFPDRRFPLRVAQGGAREIEVVLDAAQPPSAVTVTASPGVAEEDPAQRVSLVGRERIEDRAKAVLAQAAEEEPGLALQRTSPTIGGIFVRGLTGAKVNVFVDGVRYSTGAQRGGINTFFHLLAPGQVEAVEVLRGPSSAQYGGDALGGSVQVLSRAPRGGGFHGEAAVGGGTADMSGSPHLTLSYEGGRAQALLSLGAARHNTLRPGGGVDSHSAVTRFLGLPSTVLGSPRLPDTAFTQYGALLRGGAALGQGQRVTAHYQRNQQDGGKRYDQLLGGDGNLVADLRNLAGDLGYVRWERLSAGALNTLRLTYSFNAQREERVNQGGGGNPLAAIQHERERTVAHGVQAMALRQASPRHALALGGDVYLERMRAPSWGWNPASGAVAARRGRIPDGARYTHGGVFAQHVWDAGRLRLANNLRWSGAAYAVDAGPRGLWPADSLGAGNVSFRSGAVVRATGRLSLNGGVSRGFRAPHVTDLGTLGLTGSGFEAAAPDLAGRSAFLGTTSGADAVSTGRRLEQVRPETSLNWEVGARVRVRRVDAEVSWFTNTIRGNIEKQALILPPGAVGTTLAGQPVTAQTPGGAVFVPLAANPVLVRANIDNARIRGLELRARTGLSRHVAAEWGYTRLIAEDPHTGRPPNIEGGTPPPRGYARLRWSRHRFWAEPYAQGAWRQTRLSTLDLSDRRTGAARTRSSIAAFFGNGAAARGLVSTAGILLATGETLAQVQDRVVGRAESAPLFAAVPGYVLVGVRAGVELGEGRSLLADFENALDRNYRGVSWGVDGPGRGVSVRFVQRF